MKKSIKIIVIFFGVILVAALLYFGFIKYQEFKEAERIRNAIIKVELIDPLEVEFQSAVKLSDLIVSINGTLCDDFIIETNKLEKKVIKFYYIN